MKRCKICLSDTNSIFNINFKAIDICENCATEIALQQITAILIEHQREYLEESNDRCICPKYNQPHNPKLISGGQKKNE